MEMRIIVIPGFQTGWFFLRSNEKQLNIYKEHASMLFSNLKVRVVQQQQEKRKKSFNENLLGLPGEMKWHWN